MSTLNTTFSRRFPNLNHGAPVRRAAAALLTLCLVAATAHAGPWRRAKGELASAPTPHRQDTSIEGSGLATPKRSVAVARFGALNNFDIQLGGSFDVGDSLTAMLTTGLDASGRFLVVERPGLADALEEQRLSANGLTSGPAAAKVGQLIGAQWLITGQITEFSQADAGRGTRLGVARAGGLLGISPQKRVGSVALDLRVVEPSSGRVVKTVRAAAKITGRSLGVDLSVRGIHLGDTRFQKTPLGQAARAAIHDAVGQLIGFIDSQPWSASVVSWDGAELVLNVGSDSGLAAGLEFDVVRNGRAVVDPQTGAVLGHRRSAVGTAVVTEVHDQFAIARFDGPVAPQTHDLITLNN